MIRSINLSTITISAAGTGTGVTARPVNGKILAVVINFTSAGATCDTTITLDSDGVVPARTLLTVTDSTTDATYQVRHVVHDEAGAVQTYDGTREVHGMVPSVSTISASAAQGTENGTIAISVIYEE